MLTHQICWYCAAWFVFCVRERNRHSDTAAISKQALKRKQRSDLWIATGRTRMKQRSKEKRRAKRDRQREQRRKMLLAMTKEERKAFISRERREQEAREQSKANTPSITVAVDFYFDRFNKDFETTSLIRQTVASYAIIKRMPKPFNLTLCSIDPGCRVHKALAAVQAHNWKGVCICERNAASLFAKDHVIMLSPDAHCVLERLDENKVYVIGAMVDNFRMMRTTLDEANVRGHRCARLPVPEVLGAKVDPVLNIDTVIQIMAVFHETGSWRQALQAVPARKRR